MASNGVKSRQDAARSCVTMEVGKVEHAWFAWMFAAMSGMSGVSVICRIKTYFNRVLHRLSVHATPHTCVAEAESVRLWKTCGRQTILAAGDSMQSALTNQGRLPANPAHQAALLKTQLDRSSSACTAQAAVTYSRLPLPLTMQLARYRLRMENRRSSATCRTCCS